MEQFISCKFPGKLMLHPLVMLSFGGDVHQDQEGDNSSTFSGGGASSAEVTVRMCSG